LAYTEIMPTSDQCSGCALYRGLGECAAFPDGIPQEIMSGEFDHSEPHPRDGGRRYVPATGTELDRQYKWPQGAD
jgi:hypothetical protein